MADVTTRAHRKACKEARRCVSSTRGALYERLRAPDAFERGRHQQRKLGAFETDVGDTLRAIAAAKGEQ